MGEALDVGIVLGFDHDAGELLGAGIAEDDAAVFAERSVGFREGADNFGNRVKRRLGFDLHVDDGLGVILEAGDEGIKAALESDERSDFNGGEEAVAGGRIIEKDYVAGLFAAEDVAALEHFFQNVAVADIGASERNIFAGKDAFEAEIGHGSGDDAIAGQFILGSEIARDGEKNAVPVDDGAVCRNEKSAIGVPIESNTECSTFRRHALLQFFEVERTAGGVDVAAVGFDADTDDVATETGEKFRAKLVGGAVGTVQNDAEAFERSAGDNAATQKIEVLMMKRSIGPESRQSE